MKLRILHFGNNARVKLKVMVIGFSVLGNQRLGDLYGGSAECEQGSVLIWTGCLTVEKKKVMDETSKRNNYFILKEV